MLQNPFNLKLKNKIMKIEHKKIFRGPFEKYFMAHQYMPKIFHDPHKNPSQTPLPPSPTDLMYGP